MLERRDRQEAERHVMYHLGLMTPSRTLIGLPDL